MGLEKFLSTDPNSEKLQGDWENEFKGFESMTHERWQINKSVYDNYVHYCLSSRNGTNLTHIRLIYIEYYKDNSHKRPSGSALASIWMIDNTFDLQFNATGDVILAYNGSPDLEEYARSEECQEELFDILETHTNDLGHLPLRTIAWMKYCAGQEIKKVKAETGGYSGINDTMQDLRRIGHEQVEELNMIEQELETLYRNSPPIHSSLPLPDKLRNFYPIIDIPIHNPQRLFEIVDHI